MFCPAYKLPATYPITHPYKNAIKSYNAMVMQVFSPHAPGDEPINTYSINQLQSDTGTPIHYRHDTRISVTHWAVDE